MLFLTAVIILLLFLRPAPQPIPISDPLPPTIITITPGTVIPVTPLPPPPDDIPREPAGVTNSGPIVVVDQPSNSEPIPTAEHINNTSTDNNTEGAGVLIVIDPPDKGIIDEPAYERHEVTEQALFQGGTVDKFRLWLIKRIHYPEEAIRHNIKGMVTVKFAVGKDGKICDVNVERGIHPLIDEAVVKTLLSSPKWEPAKLNGRPVKVFYHVPVKFDLKQ
jgi:protein TonB